MICLDIAYHISEGLWWKTTGRKAEAKSVIYDKLLLAKVIHMDETGFWIQEKGQWLHVASTSHPKQDYGWRRWNSTSRVHAEEEDDHVFCLIPNVIFAIKKTEKMCMGYPLTVHGGKSYLLIFLFRMNKVILRKKTLFLCWFRSNSLA